MNAIVSLHLNRGHVCKLNGSELRTTLTNTLGIEI